MNKNRLCFDVIGSIIQTIEIILPGMTIEDVVKGLNDGIYMTTLEVDHDVCFTEPRYIIKFETDGSETKIAKIVTQLVAPEIQYSRFQVDEEFGV